MYNFVKRRSHYFDDKKTTTRVMINNEKTNKWRLTIMVLHHCVVVVEPDNEYLTHATPKTGYGRQIATNIHAFLVEENQTQQLIGYVISDRTNQNIVSENEAIRHLEMLPALLSHCSASGIDEVEKDRS